MSECRRRVAWPRTRALGGARSHARLPVVEMCTALWRVHDGAVTGTVGSMTNRRLATALVLASAASVVGVARADLRLPDPDVTPPEVAIVQPRDGARFPDPATAIVVIVEASDPGPVSSGVSRVWLEIDDVADMPATEAPWEFALSLETGSHTVRAYASDWEGNVGESARIRLDVGESEDASEDSADTPALGSRGCSCTTSPSRSPAPPWLLFALVALRRRRGQALRQ
jgi:MYXO-CTERM domain-containing protein